MPNTRLATSTPQGDKKSGSNTAASQPSGLSKNSFSTKRDNAKAKSSTDKQVGGRKGHQ